MTILDNLTKGVRARISVLEKASDEEVVGEIESLRKDKKAWAGLAKGNRHYFETALERWGENPDSAHNYIRGAVNHLIKAAPHQLGFIAEKTKSGYKKGKALGKEEMYNKVLTAEINISKLSGKDLMELAKYVESDSDLSSLGAYKGSRSSVRLMLGKYDRLKAKSSGEASAYSKEKADSLRNIFGKTYIPNLLGQIARDYEKGRG